MPDWMIVPLALGYISCVAWLTIVAPIAALVMLVLSCVIIAQVGTA